MKINSKTPIRATQQMIETNQDFDEQIELKHKKNAKKPKLVHSNTMPVPIKYNKTKTDAAKNKKKRKRRHSTAGDWTSNTTRQRRMRQRIKRNANGDTVRLAIGHQIRQDKVGC